MSKRRLFRCKPWHCLLIAILSGCSGPKEQTVSFNRDIRPILNAKCLSCHGGVKQLGEYSLLFPEEAYDTTASGKYGIVPGKPSESELFVRLLHDDPELRMPYEQPPLSKREIRLFEKWIEEGARWETHWAFVPPDPSLKPPVYKDKSWPRHPIDHFIGRRLEENDLEPAPAAAPDILLRRLHLDLTGLPPTLEAINSFRNNGATAEDYEREVDKLLASPHFGEHWASMWLDLARYGDSQGYQKDPIRRTIWRYRDWVINAFNRDMPFDRFTIEQLAGDQIEDRTNDQLLATAFHRNTNTNDEGGTDNEEFRVVAVLDRLNTTYEVWQGMTMSCVQCHSHPYDPILHEEYYRSMAFFNNTQDADLPSEEPKVALLSPGQRYRIDTLTRFLEQHRQDNDTLSESFREAVAQMAGIQPAPVPVMLDFPPDTTRPSHVFIRGNWLSPGERVAPGVPSSLNPGGSDPSPNRLGLAKWLVSNENPLTARVVVNRFWAGIFGRGLVETVEDFGTQGAPPTHPELLDWLAARFVHRHDWSVKALLKDMVMSAAYQQAATVSAEKLEIDPYNQLLSRGPRFRLSAEQIRDQSLAVSGLLSKKMYGPSVMPPQPEGVWNTIRHVARWKTSPGEDRYRRAVYTFLRKTSPYPSFLTFDSPSREICVSRRIRTNTPLQAMVTLNDPVYVEAAKALATKMLRFSGKSPEEQIARGYEMAVMRPPAPEKLEELLNFHEIASRAYEQSPEAAQELLAANQASERNPDFAAMTNVASIILNLDEFLNN